MTATPDTTATPHTTAETTYTVRRLTVPVPGVREFQRAYEQAVPNAPYDEVNALVRKGAPWSDMVKLIDDRAPNGFFIYFRNDVHPVMQAAGDPADSIAHLIAAARRGASPRHYTELGRHLSGRFS